MNPYFRWWHWLRANLIGYFWGPCPICCRNYGGHEKGAIPLMDSWGSGRMVCRACTEKAQARNSDWMKAHPHPPILVNTYINMENVMP